MSDDGFGGEGRERPRKSFEEELAALLNAVLFCRSSW